MEISFKIGLKKNLITTLYLFFNLILINLFLPAFSASEKVNFSKKFIELSQDGYLDKNEFLYLKKITKNNLIEDKEFANQTIKNLSKFSERIKLDYSIEDVSGKITNLHFIFTPTYSENELIKGKNMLEVAANISQKDNLDETKSDDARCGTASLVNAYLIMGGNFKKLAREFSLSSEKTYKNIHLIQEKLYDIANVEKKDGIYSGFKYKTSISGKISDIRPSGEIVYASDKIGIGIIPLVGKTVDTMDNKRDAVLEFFNKNPRGVLQIGVYLDTKTGELLRPSNEFPQNHFIIAVKKDKSYYILDTSRVNNGDGKNIKKMSNQDINDLIYYTSGIINGLILNNIKFY
ncbi:MAG: hypothetical protein U0457_07860 [Candidatus Sericytochromatia bacterium]